MMDFGTTDGGPFLLVGMHGFKKVKKVIILPDFPNCINPKKEKGGNDYWVPILDGKFWHIFK